VLELFIVTDKVIVVSVIRNIRLKWSYLILENIVVRKVADSWTFFP